MKDKSFNFNFADSGSKPERIRVERLFGRSSLPDVRPSTDDGDANVNIDNDDVTGRRRRNEYRDGDAKVGDAENGDSSSR